MFFKIAQLICLFLNVLFTSERASAALSKANSRLTMCQQSDRTVMTIVGYMALGKIVHLGPIKYVDEDIAECQFH